MAIGKIINYATTDELFLDPKNPRLGRLNMAANLKQEQILELMADWVLEELAESFLESGFWPNEALLVVKEKLGGKERLVVIEGNRRLAALKYLQQAYENKPSSRKWANIAAEGTPAKDLFTRIPYLLVDSRRDVEAFLGFRHVTGIKEWKPAEKAQYITQLIEDRGMTYEEVMQKIGSRTQTVRQNYISYKVLLQMEDQGDIDVEQVENKFSVLYLSLRTEGVRTYLQLNMQADPEAAQQPVPPERLKQLAYFAQWLFGSRNRPPLITDSRLVDRFSTVLLSNQAVEYLERTDNPSLDVAYRTAGGDESELVRLIANAADNVELVLSRAHFYAQSESLQLAVDRLGSDALQLLRTFPVIRERLLKDDK